MNKTVRACEDEIAAEGRHLWNPQWWLLYGPFEVGCAVHVTGGAPGFRSARRESGSSQQGNAWRCSFSRATVSRGQLATSKQVRWCRTTTDPYGSCVDRAITVARSQREERHEKDGRVRERPRIHGDVPDA